MAEAEFTTDEDDECFVPPLCCLYEVTTDVRFTGGRLVHSSGQEVYAWLADYHLTPG